MIKLPIHLSEFGVRVLLVAVDAYREKLNHFIAVDEHRPPEQTAPVELVQYWRAQHEQLGAVERQLQELSREFEIDASFVVLAEEPPPPPAQTKSQRRRRAVQRPQATNQHDFGT